MAKSIFSNLNVLNTGKGGIKAMFDKNPTSGLSEITSSINKEAGDGKMGTRINTTFLGETNAFKSDVKSKNDTAWGGPSEMHKAEKSAGNPKDATKKELPAKTDEKKEQKPWTKETQPPPDVDVKNNKDDYSGKVTKKDKSAVPDEDKKKQQEKYSEGNEDQAGKQEVPKDRAGKREDSKLEPKPLKDTIGKSPTIMEMPLFAETKPYNMVNPQNPNPEMYPGSSFQAGQAPTPKFPTNNVTKMVSGMKQPPTTRPSLRLPKG